MPPSFTNQIKLIKQRIEEENFIVFEQNHQHLLVIGQREHFDCWKIPPRFQGLSKPELYESFTDQHDLFLVVHAGQAGVIRVQNFEIVSRQIFRRYMVRKSQGKAQINYLKQKGKSRLGSRIRLQQSKLFFEDINQWLERQILQYGEAIANIYLSCSPVLKGIWWKDHPPTSIKKEDPRWQRIPFHCHLPNQEVMDDIVRQMFSFQRQGLDDESVPWEQ